MEDIKYENIGMFPECMSKVDLEKTLFVNNWNPHSYAGNGNFRDDSIDGYFGRVSSIALLSCPFTNGYIKYFEVTF